MTPAAWAHLPNAKHIDDVLAWLKTPAAKYSARNAAWEAAWIAAKGAAWGAAKDAARDVSWGAIAALIAYDDIGRWLSPEVPVETMRVTYRLNPSPALELLLPYKTLIANL